MSSNHLIQLEGTHEQAHELLKAVEAGRISLMGLGGDDAKVDMIIEKRLVALSYWSEHIANRVEGVEK